MIDDDHDIYHWLLTPVLSACMRHNVTFTMWGTNYKQLLDEVFVISGVIKVEVSVIARLMGILCNLWTPRLSIFWHHRPLCQVSVDSRSPYRLTVGRHVNRYVGLHSTDMVVSVSANICQHYRPICQSTCQHSLGRLSLNTSANMLTESRVMDVSGEINRGLANMSTDMANERQIHWKPRLITLTET